MTAQPSEPYDREPFPLPEPCRRCGAEVGSPGELTTTGGQDILRCATCQTYIKAVPKHETGRAVRSMRTRPQISPSQRHRVFQSYGNRCVRCGGGTADGVRLELGHIISVDIGRRAGLTDTQLWSDDNLAPFCDQDNNGQNHEPMRLGFAIALLRCRLLYGDITDPSNDPQDEGRLL